MAATSVLTMCMSVMQSTGLASGQSGLSLLATPTAACRWGSLQAGQFECWVAGKKVMVLAIPGVLCSPLPMVLTAAFGAHCCLWCSLLPLVLTTAFGAHHCLWCSLLPQMLEPKLISCVFVCVLGVIWECQWRWGCQAGTSLVNFPPYFFPYNL